MNTPLIPHVVPHWWNAALAAAHRHRRPRYPGRYQFLENAELAREMRHP